MNISLFMPNVNYGMHDSQVYRFDLIFKVHICTHLIFGLLKTKRNTFAFDLKMFCYI